VSIAGHRDRVTIVARNDLNTYIYYFVRWLLLVPVICTNKMNVLKNNGGNC